MCSSTPSYPSLGDDQVIHLLLKRGLLDNDQLLFARAYHELSTAPSLLATVLAEGYLAPADLAAFHASYQADTQVAAAVVSAGLLTSRQLALAERERKGARRSLAAALVEAGHCTQAALNRALDRQARGVRPITRLADFRRADARA